MIQTQTEINLPKEAYDIELQGSTFNIQPLSQECIDLLEQLQSCGATIIINSEDKPTSIFIRYNSNVMDKTNYHHVVGAKLNMHLYLVGNYTKRYAERLKNFLQAIEDVNGGCLPEVYDKTDVKWVTIIKTYDF